MNNTNVFIALRTIALNASNTAPVTLKVGYTDETNFIQHNEVVIIDCPPATITALQKEGFVIEMSQIAGGIVLDDYNIKGLECELCGIAFLGADAHPTGTNVCPECMEGQMKGVSQ